MSENPRDEQGWEAGWEEHRLAQRRRLAALPLVEKLAWLESAQQLAEFMQKRRIARSDPERDSPGRTQG